MSRRVARTTGWRRIATGVLGRPADPQIYDRAPLSRVPLLVLVGEVCAAPWVRAYLADPLAFEPPDIAATLPHGGRRLREGT